MLKTNSENLAIAAAAIRKHCQLTPEIIIVLGSGLGGLADAIQHPTDIEYQAVPGFPIATATGHAGKLRFGYLGGLPVVAMCGRAHLYEGHSVASATFPIACLNRLGAQTLIVSNASGGLNPRFHTGQLVLIDSHINWMHQKCIEADHSASAAGAPIRNEPIYDLGLMRTCQELAIREGFSLERATYLATLGPTYETRAEYRFFRQIGADLAGMSTVPEVELGASLGMRILAFSVVTNVANPDCQIETTHEEVLDWANTAQQRLVPLVQKLLDSLSGPPD